MLYGKILTSGISARINVKKQTRPRNDNEFILTTVLCGIKYEESIMIFIVV